MAVIIKSTYSCQTKNKDLLTETTHLLSFLYQTIFKKMNEYSKKHIKSINSTANTNEKDEITAPKRFIYI